MFEFSGRHAGTNSSRCGPKPLAPWRCILNRCLVQTRFCKPVPWKPRRHHCPCCGNSVPSGKKYSCNHLFLSKGYFSPDKMRPYRCCCSLTPFSYRIAMALFHMKLELASFFSENSLSSPMAFCICAFSHRPELTSP